MSRLKELLDPIYFASTGEAGSFSSPDKLYRVAHKKHPHLTRKDVKKYLEGVYAYTRHARVLRRFLTRSFLSLAPHEFWQLDLIYLRDMKSISNQKVRNKFNFAIMICDMWSHKGYGEPLNRKTPDQTLLAFKKILSRVKKQPLKIQVDKGGEFGQNFASYCKSVGIILYSSTTKWKAARVEVLNRDVKLYLARLMTHYHSKNAARFLQNALDIYNNTSSVGLPSGMSPNDAEKPANLARVQLFYLKKRALLAQKILKRQPAPKFKLGDRVRKVEATKLGAQRVSKPRFSEELYTITGITKTLPRGYHIGVYKNGKPQFFYGYELRPASQRDSDYPTINGILSSQKRVLSFLRNGKPKNVQIEYLTAIEGKNKPKYLTKEQILTFRNGKSALDSFEKNHDINKGD